MTASVFHALKDLREIGGDLTGRLGALEVYDVFQPLIDTYGADVPLFNSLVFYILDAYSVDSPAIVVEADWFGIKQRLFKKNDLPEKMEREVVLLGSAPFAQTVRAYVDYQQSETFRHYCMLRDLYTQMLDIALISTDVDDKYKAQAHAKNLLNEIDQFKNRLKTDFSLLSPDESKLPGKKAVSSKIALSLAVEEFATGKDGE